MPDPRFHTNHGPFPLGTLAELSETALAEGADPRQLINDVAPLNNAGPGQISFFDNPKYLEAFVNSKASACVAKPRFQEAAPAGMALLLTEHPYQAYAKLAQAFYHETPEIGVHPSATVADSAVIGKGCSIGANSYIGNGVIIGDNVQIAPNVTVTHAMIGNDVILHSGVRIGQEGFGFANDKGHHIKVPQLGRVIIEDEVEIGANSCIDRGAGPDTIIGAGTKIDNLVQIAHNVKIGKGCIIVSHVGISGSVELGNHVVVGGQVGIAGHLHIGDGAKIAAQSGVMRNVPPRMDVGGSPALPVREWHRQNSFLRKLAKERSKSDA